MVDLRMDLDLSKSNTLDELYNIKFEFTNGKFKARNLQNAIGFDTETSSGFCIPMSNRVIPFLQEEYDRAILKTHNVPKDKIDFDDEDIKYMSLLDSCIPCSLTYMFQVAIEDGDGGIYSFVGRTLKEFDEFLNKLTGEIKRQAAFGFKSINREYETKKAATLRQNIHMSIFVQNLGFDFQTALRTLYNDRFVNSKHNRVFSRKSRKPMKASMRLNDVTITFKDTLCLSQKSLAALAHDCPECPIEKVPEFDYLTIKTPDDKLTDLEIKYGIHDVAILVYYIAYERKQFGSIEAIPITQTGKVRRVLESKVCAPNPYWAYICSDITKHYSPDEYRTRIALYMGGYTHGCSLHIGKVGEVHMYDFASSYPSSLTTGYFPCNGYHPCDVMEFYDLEKQDVERPKYRWFAKIKLTNVRAAMAHSYWSSSKCVECGDLLNDNGRIRRASYMTIWVTDLDWDTFKHAYKWEEMEVLEVEKGEASLLPIEMINTILDYYSKKCLLKGDEDRISEYTESKEFINSIYGNFCFKQVADQIYFDENGWETRSLDEEGDRMFYELLSEVSETKANGFFDLGLICSAIARHRLWEFIIKFDSKVWYVDTDSIKGTFDDEDRKWIENYNKKIESMENDVAAELGIDPMRFCPVTSKGVHKRLGIMEYEGQAKLKYLGAKRYITEEDGVIHCTIAGLPKKAGSDKIKSFDDFDNNTLWTTAESKKVCCYYNDNQPENLEWTGRDGQVYISSDKYGVCLKPVTFDLSMSEEFVAFLNLLFNGNMDRDITEDVTPKYLLR